MFGVFNTKLRLLFKTFFYLFGTYVNKVKFKLLTGRSGKHRMYLVVVKQINIQQRSVSRELP